MINLLKKIIPVKLYRSAPILSFYKLFVDVYKNISFSQEGEDLILSRMFYNQKTGFYVDVGAHHPKRFSNTWIFYKKGWSGINIDAMPGCMKRFKKLRPRDINVEAAISQSVTTLNYYSFKEGALNTLDEDLAKERIKENVLLGIYPLQTSRLDEILDKYMPFGVQIDFLTIDVEGLDEQVLLSNNWEKYKPKYILVESGGISLFDIKEYSTSKILIQYGYTAVFKTHGNIFYKRNYD